MRFRRLKLHPDGVLAARAPLFLAQKRFPGLSKGGFLLSIAGVVLTSLKVRDFRCFKAFEASFARGSNAIVGPNARGKTSLLEAACVMLRLQSPRAAGLAPLVRVGAAGLVVDGFYDGVHMQFYYSPRRRKLALDSVEQQKARAYLDIGRVVWFSNLDIQMVRGGAEERRRYLDFVATQISPLYRTHLKSFERALRARNFLLKGNPIRWREIAAFDEPLVQAGEALTAARALLVKALGREAAEAHRAISGSRAETLEMTYQPGSGESLSESLALSRDESQRLRQTVVGPHRDEVAIALDGLPVALGSEGQQRTVALAMRLAQARLLKAEGGRTPLLLLDDVFGELDVERRNALLATLPPGAQRIITTTHLDWMEGEFEQVIRL